MAKRVGRSNRKLAKQSRLRRLDPLISTRGEDGLWQSIEKDEAELASSDKDSAVSPINEPSLVAKENSALGQDVVHRPHRDISTAGQTARTSGTLSADDIKPIKEETLSASQLPIAPTKVDILNSLLTSPAPYPSPPTPARPVTELPLPVPPTPSQPPPAPKRRRGRPRKSKHAPNWNKRRRIRFSDPIPSNPDPQPEESRDSHVFVRLLKIVVTVDNPPPSQRQELVWNNRSKGWRLAGERSERNIGDIGELFDDLSAHGSQLRVLLAPTVGRGAREPVEMGWNAARWCFQGANHDLGSLSVALGEMKDMVKDPWARQFVGHVLG